LNTQDATLTTDASANQSEFWNQSAGSKVFSHPLDHARFERLVARDASILDYGCGYGRLCGELAGRGFTDVVGADFSTEMIATARRDQPSVSFTHVDGVTLPFGEASFDAVLLFAVLTCIPPRAAQRTLVAELHRVLKRGGLLVVSDYPLQSDLRNVDRYEAFASETHGAAPWDYGTFRRCRGSTSFSLSSL
jgi:SAM-dependent methyltransferase